MFLFVCKQAFHLSWVRISQKINGVIMKNLRHIFMKISLDFYIYISVLLAVTVTAKSSFLCLDCVKSVQISCPYFPVFGLDTEIYGVQNTGKYGPEITPYLDNFHAVWTSITPYS